MKKYWWVYILRCSDQTLYTGISTDMLARLEKHNSGKGAKYTRARLPVILVWSMRCKNESLARKKEAEIKSWPREKKIALIDHKEK